jgi:hypothetical protein
MPSLLPSLLASYQRTFARRTRRYCLVTFTSVKFLSPITITTTIIITIIIIIINAKH